MRVAISLASSDLWFQAQLQHHLLPDAAAVHRSPTAGERPCPLQKEGAVDRLPEALAPAEGRAVQRSENKQSCARRLISCGLSRFNARYTRTEAQSGANACSTPEKAQTLRLDQA